MRKISKKQRARNFQLAQIPYPVDGRCQECKCLPDWRGLHKDHIISRAQGGSDKVENIRWLCAVCHIDKKHRKGGV